MRRFVLLLSLVWVLFGADQALAQSRPDPSRPAPSRLDEITDRGVLRVGLTGDYRPFSLKDASDTYAGRISTWRRALPTLWAGDRADDMGRTLERALPS